jgi:hypothetical protein
MCQKATGGVFAAYVTAENLVWTRGEPKRFQSSNLIKRGFCPECGTQLTFEGKHSVDLTIGAFDDPTGIAPEFQIGVESKLPYADRLASLPGRPPEEEARLANYYAAVVSFQHPDHDTAEWPAVRT